MENSHLISQIQNLLDEYVKIERWIGVSMESDEWEELIWEKSEELLKLLTQNQITENIIKKSINNRKGRKNVILFFASTLYEREVDKDNSWIIQFIKKSLLSKNEDERYYAIQELWLKKMTNVANTLTETLDYLLRNEQEVANTNMLLNVIASTNNDTLIHTLGEIFEVSWYQYDSLRIDNRIGIVSVIAPFWTKCIHPEVTKILLQCLKNIDKISKTYCDHASWGYCPPFPKFQETKDSFMSQIMWGLARNGYTEYHNNLKQLVHTSGGEYRAAQALNELYNLNLPTENAKIFIETIQQKFPL